MGTGARGSHLTPDLHGLCPCMGCVPEGSGKLMEVCAACPAAHKTAPSCETLAVCVVNCRVVSGHTIFMTFMNCCEDKLSQTVMTFHNVSWGFIMGFHNLHGHTLCELSRPRHNHPRCPPLPSQGRRRTCRHTCRRYRPHADDFTLPPAPSDSDPPMGCDTIPTPASRHALATHPKCSVSRRAYAV